VKQALATASTRTICRVLGVVRSALYRHQPAGGAPRHAADDAEVIVRIHQLIQIHPTYGYRRMWARSRFGDGRIINRKKVRWLLRQQGWMVRQRPAPKPRVQRKKSVATRTNERWALQQWAETVTTYGIRSCSESVRCRSTPMGTCCC
jgi:putative transposase